MRVMSTNDPNSLQDHAGQLLSCMWFGDKSIGKVKGDIESPTLATMADPQCPQSPKRFQQLSAKSGLEKIED